MKIDIPFFTRESEFFSLLNSEQGSIPSHSNRDTLRTGTAVDSKNKNPSSDKEEKVRTILN
jgi:hypothetical protein